MRVTAKPRPWNWVPVAGLVVAGIGIGVTITAHPALAWILLGGATGLFLLQAPPYVWACGAVIAVAFSRLAVAWGLAPGFVNFFHFPLVLGAAFLAAVSPPHPGEASHRGLRHLAYGIVSVGVVALISWAINGGELVRPIFAWVSFTEPFLMIYAIIKTAPATRNTLLASLVLTVALAQVPFAFWQAAVWGLGDPVQGTFIRQGAGSHVAGAITLLGAIVLISGLFGSTFGFVRWFISGLLITLFLSVAVLADAKQVVVAFILALAFLLWNQGILRAQGLVIAVLVVAMVVAAGVMYEPLRRVTDLDLVRQGLGGKLLSYQIIMERMLHIPTGLLLGLGPGNSVSRAALAAQEEYVRSLPGGVLDLQLSSITAEILSSTAGYYLFASSSVWSGVSSWLGLFGDLGLAGLAAYVWMLWSVWILLRTDISPWSAAARAAVIVAVALGTMFSWLETPEFTLPWALYVATGILSTGHANSYRP